MKIVQIPNGAFLENSYLVIDEASGDCAIVDPGDEAGLILHKAELLAVRTTAVWLTHAHVDHVAGVRRIREATGAPVSLHPLDRPLYDRVPEQAAAFGLESDPQPPPDHAFSHGEVARVGGLSFTVRHAPGHSPGSVVLAGEGVVFSGDVLFRGSIGRADLPGGNLETLLASIERELLVLPDSTIVYSGHGPETTIGVERRTNPFLTGAFPLG